MDVPLDPEIERVVLDKVAKAEYRSVVELVEEALFLLVERDWSRTQAELQGEMPAILRFEALIDSPSGGDQP